MSNKNSGGFTLIELLVVISLLGLLASLILVWMGSVRAQGRDAQRVAETDALRKALEMYYDEHGDYPLAATWVKIEENSALSNALKPWLPKTPSDPLYPKEDGSKIYSYQYQSTPDQQGYKIHVEMETGKFTTYQYEVISGTGGGIVYGGGSAATNTISLVDTIGNVGYYTSIVIGTDGLPVISYQSDSNGYLKVAKCGNAACSAGNTTTSVDASGFVGEWTSIAIGTDGFPVISYKGATGLRVAKCGNAACSAGNTTTSVDASVDVSYGTSIAIGTDGFPVISYKGAATGLRVAKCGNAACSAGNTITSVEASALYGDHSSIAIGTDGFPVMSYHDGANDDLKVAKCGNAACSAGNIFTSVDGASERVGDYSSIAIGVDGLPVISYRTILSRELKVAKCGNAACSAGNTITSVDTDFNVGFWTSIAIGTDGFPVISHQSAGYQIRVAKCGNAACSAGNTITIVDVLSDGYTSIAVGSDGLPVISYLDKSNFDLKVAKCGTSSCAP